MRNNKAEFSIAQIIALVLVLIVVAVVLMFALKINIFDWFNILSSYKLPEEDKIIDVDNLIGQQIEVSECFAYIGDVENGKQFIYLGQKDDSTAQNTNLYIGSFKDGNGIIKRKEGFLGLNPTNAFSDLLNPDSKVAEIKNWKIEVLEEFSDKPLFSALNNRVIKENNKICKPS